MNVAEILTANPPLFAGVVGLFGLLVGSFLNVVIYRLPIMLEREWKDSSWSLLWGGMPQAPGPAADRFDLTVPRSACPSCGTQITALQNVPVLSWLILGGKCAACRVRIPARYPVIEGVTGHSLGRRRLAVRIYAGLRRRAAADMGVDRTDRHRFRHAAAA